MNTEQLKKLGQQLSVLFEKDNRFELKYLTVTPECEFDCDIWKHLESRFTDLSGMISFGEKQIDCCDSYAIVWVGDSKAINEFQDILLCFADGHVILRSYQEAVQWLFENSEERNDVERLTLDRIDVGEVVSTENESKSFHCTKFEEHIATVMLDVIDQLTTPALTIDTSKATVCIEGVTYSVDERIAAILEMLVSANGLAVPSTKLRQHPLLRLEERIDRLIKRFRKDHPGIAFLIETDSTRGYRLSERAIPS